MRNLWRGVALAGAAAAALYAMQRRPRVRMDLRGKVVVILGGSRGLGLQLARDCADRGCKVAICARDAADLERARKDLASHGGSVFAQACDVANRAGIEEFLRQAGSKLGPVDVLINCAGIIEVGPFETQDLASFTRAMDIMYWGPLYAIRAVYPQMKQRGSGVIVNITSIGGRIGVPHLAPYCAAKFAFVGLSESLTAEFAPEGIRVLTVVPGLMRTGSHLNALFRSRPEKEFQWFAVGATAPGVAVSARHAADEVLRAIEDGSRECTIGLPAQAASLFHGIAPGLSTGLAALAKQALLPEAGDERQSIRGSEARERLHSRSFNLLIRPGDRPALALNQVR